jgi:hypothetical protein
MECEYTQNFCGEVPVRRWITIVLGALTLGSGSAIASGLDFKLINATGYNIQAIYVDPTGSDAWSSNILGSPELADGEFATVTFEGDPDSCKWDIKVDWVGDYASTAWQGLNLCKISEITLKYDSDTDETTAELQ